MKMKLSYTTMATPELTLLQSADAAREYGFDGIDLRLCGVTEAGEVPCGISSKEAEKIKTAVRGLSIPGLLCYNRNIHAGAEEMKSSVLKCLSAAEKIGAESIRIFTGKLDGQDDLRCIAKVLNEILRMDNSGVKIALQNHVNNGVSVKQAIQLCDMTSSERIGFIFSPDQALIGDESPEGLYQEITRITTQVYVADIDRNNSFTLIGDGIIPFAEVFDRLFGAGFDGYITLKWERCWYPEMPDYKKAFSVFMDFIKGYEGTR